MDVTVYLPDEIGRWAKDQKTNLSAMLRAELETERHRQAAVAEAVGRSAEHRLRVEGDRGAYTVRLHGTVIAEDQDVQVFLGEDESVHVYEIDRERLRQLGEYDNVSEWLRGWLVDDESYVEAMAALGEEAVIDVGRSN